MRRGLFILHVTRNLHVRLSSFNTNQSVQLQSDGWLRFAAYQAATVFQSFAQPVS